MRFISGIRATAIAGALLALPGAEVAQAGGFGGGGHGGGGFGGGGFAGRPAVGVGAYAPGQGPTGAAGLGLGANRRGVLNGFWGGGYGGSGGGEAISSGNSTNVYTYNHYDNRRRDGGFYGGGGAFYPDDGYSRLWTYRRPEAYDDPYSYGPSGYAPQTVYRPSQHIFYLPGNNRRAARKGARHAAD